MRTNTHTQTRAHTQVSTLPPADRIGLKNQCTATDTYTFLRTHFQAFMNPAEIFSLVGLSKSVRRYLRHLSFSASCAWPFLHSLVINLWNVMKIIYFAVNNEGSNKSDYFPNPWGLLPWRFTIYFLFKDKVAASVEEWMTLNWTTLN